MQQLAQRRQPQQQRSRERLERLLDAADTVLGRDGYERYSTAAAAAEAGMPTPAVYRFFADQEELARAVVLRHLERLGAALEAAVAALDARKPRRFVATLLGTYVDYMREHPSFRVLWLDRRIGAATVAEVHDFLAALSREHRRVGIAHGWIPPHTTVAEVLILSEMTDRVLELAFREDPRGDDDVLGRGEALLFAASGALGASQTVPTETNVS